MECVRMVHCDACKCKLMRAICTHIGRNLEIAFARVATIDEDFQDWQCLNYYWKKIVAIHFYMIGEKTSGVGFSY